MVGLELLSFALVVLLAGACGGHHHHSRVSHLTCERDEARGALGRRSRDDETWRPAHLSHRVHDIFDMVEDARLHHTTACLREVATPHGVDTVVADFRGGRYEGRELEHVAIAVAIDRPGDCDDEAYVTLETFEHDCHEHVAELWKLVRGHDRDWILDDVFRGNAMRQAIAEARSRSGPSRGQRREDGAGAVRKLG